jgi:hypothetical protein
MRILEEHNTYSTEFWKSINSSRNKSRSQEGKWRMGGRRMRWRRMEIYRVRDINTQESAVGWREVIIG